MKRRAGLALILLIVCAGLVLGCADSRPGQMGGGRTLRVLFVGNSHTYVNDLPWLVEQLAASAEEGRRLETGMIAEGGATLRGHWEAGRAREAIRTGHWDFVVLQEQSAMPLNQPDVTREYARLFDSEIRRSGARTVLYLAWARQSRPETQAALTSTYTDIARELDAELAPVGVAWQAALRENPKLALYAADGGHAAPAGSYLAACVFYSLFYGKSPEGLGRRLFSTQFGTARGGSRVGVEALSESHARTIQAAAWRAISETRDGK